jgi:hypothetical protein
MISIPASTKHAIQLARTLRNADLTELALGSGRNPLTALLESIEGSVIAQAIVDEDGDCLGIWGIAPTDHELVGCPWAMGSTRLLSSPKSFMRLCQAIEYLKHHHYPALVNAVWRGNAVSRRWLRSMGFTEVEGEHPDFIIFQSHV